jgi:hypothetical protein
MRNNQKFARTTLSRSWTIAAEASRRLPKTLRQRPGGKVASILTLVAPENGHPHLRNELANWLALAYCATHQNNNMVQF